MSIARVALSLALFLAVPATATAQDARLAERLDTATAAGVQQLVDSARRAGLPTEPLVQKALEGRRSAPAAIASSPRWHPLHGQLGRARDALGRQGERSAS